jgi:hypothetical protein
VVEHSLGKGEVESSILSGSTSFPNEINAIRGRAHSGDARARSDFADISPHRAPVAETVPKRPYRPRFFETFARALNLSVDRLIRKAE